MSKKLGYDKEHINANLSPVVDRYLGPRTRGEGERSVYACPRCGAEEFKLNPDYNGAPIIGCFKAKCDADQVMDTIDFIAFMERLEARRDFERICDMALEIIPPAPQTANTTNGLGPANATNEDGANGSASQPAAAGQPVEGQPAGNRNGSSTDEPTKASASQGLDTHEYRQLRHEAFAQLLKECPLNSRAYDFLYDRGCNDNTILDGRFGFFKADKGQQVVNKLCTDFGARIMEVPGFFKNYEQKRPGFTLMGNDWLLIPYLDRAGYITNVEGRIMPDQEDQVDQKYKSLRKSGSHAYLFPEMKWEEIEAFCEGVFGAIIAAQEGVAVASIQGYQRYRKSGGKDVLEELSGLDFANKKIAYFPDVDDPPQDDVMNRAPDAAHWLIERQNGVATIAILPEGKDLDAYLLSLPKTSGQKAIRTLVANSESLEVFKRRRQKEQQNGGSESKQGNEMKPEPTRQDGAASRDNKTDPSKDFTQKQPKQDRQADTTPGSKEQHKASAGLRQLNRSGNRSPSEGERMANMDDAATATMSDGSDATPKQASTSSSRTGRFGDALKALRGKEPSPSEGDDDKKQQPTADEVVWKLRSRGQLILKTLFVLMLTILLTPLMSAVVTAAGPSRLMATPLTLILAAAIPLAILGYLRQRAKNHRRFLEGAPPPGEKK